MMEFSIAAVEAERRRLDRRRVCLCGDGSGKTIFDLHPVFPGNFVQLCASELLCGDLGGFATSRKNISIPGGAMTQSSGYGLHRRFRSRRKCCEIVAKSRSALAIRERSLRGSNPKFARLNFATKNPSSLPSASQTRSATGLATRNSTDDQMHALDSRLRRLQGSSCSWNSPSNFSNRLMASSASAPYASSVAVAPQSRLARRTSIRLATEYRVPSFTSQISDRKLLAHFTN
jgi:hypothetical protein